MNPDTSHCFSCDAIDQYEFEVESPNSGYSRRYRPDVKFHPDVTLQGQHGKIEGLLRLPIRLNRLTWGEELAPQHLTHVIGLVLQKAERKGEFVRWGLFLMSLNRRNGNSWNDLSDSEERYDNSVEKKFDGPFGRLGPAFHHFHTGWFGHGLEFYGDGKGEFLYDVKII